jgi:crossover junction endodeoxyribonuclease RusA
MRLHLTLPYPPTVNHYWQTTVVKRGQRHVPHIYISEEGAKYRQRVKAILGGVPKLKGMVQVSIVVQPPDNRKRDLDNVLKCLLDSLTHAGLWQDDNQVGDLRILRDSPAAGGLVDLLVTDDLPEPARP